MCLDIKRNDPGVVVKAPYIAFKGVRTERGIREGMPYKYLSPYRYTPLPLGQVITAKIKIGYGGSSVSKGLHFTQTRERAHTHSPYRSRKVLYVLILPGSTVIYHEDAARRSSESDISARDCVTDKYVLFETLSDLNRWWDRHWQEYC